MRCEQCKQYIPEGLGIKNCPGCGCEIMETNIPPVEEKVPGHVTIEPAAPVVNSYSRTKRNFIILDLLIVVCSIYYSYYYFTGNVFVKTRSQFETEYHTKFQNPLKIIFTGRQSISPTSYSESDTFSRLMCFVQSAFWLLLILGVSRYYTSRRQHKGMFLFYLSINFWLVISFFVAVPFYKLYGIYHPDSGLFPLDWKIILREILVFIGLLFLIKSLISHSISLHVAAFQYKEKPIRWMRVFHFITDRLLIIIFGSNIFLFYYFALKYGAHYSINVAQQTMFNWGFVSYEVGVLLCFMLIEGFFRFSPGKVLTSTFVVNNGLDKAASWKNTVTRSIARAIPLEFLSFFSSTGWHDHFSNTSVIYIGQENWLVRFTKIINWVFVFFTIITLWLLVSSALEIRQNYDSDFEHATLLPQLLVIGMLPFLIVIFVSWIASLSNFAQNLNSTKATDNPSHFFKALFCWVPLFHFWFTMHLLSAVHENLTTTKVNTDQLLSQTKIFSRLFVTAYTLFLLGIVLYFSASKRIEVPISTCICALALIIWCLAVIRYTRHIQRILSSIPTS